MGVGLKACVVTASVGFLLSYLHVPLPQNFAEKTKMEVVDVVMRLSYAYPLRLFAWLGVNSWQVHWTRATLGLFAKILGPWSLSDPDLHIQDRVWDGVRVRVYTPKGKPSSDGAIVYIHGGGFVLMNVESYDGLTRVIARKTNVVTISIDYRLAPEHVFPAGVDDCERALIHLLASEHKALGVDPSKIVVMGDSAGGNLAAVMTHRLKKHKHLPSPKLQVLLYPVLQFADFHLPSYQQYHQEMGDTAFLDPESMARWLMLYLGIEPRPHRVAAVLANNHSAIPATHPHHHAPKLRHLAHHKLPGEFLEHSSYSAPKHSADGDLEVWSLLEEYMFHPDFSPLMAQEVSDLPSAMIVTCQFDILRDEGFLYARRLREEGVPVTHKHYSQGFHAMLNFHTEIPLAQETIKDVADFVLKNL